MKRSNLSLLTTFGSFPVPQSPISGTVPASNSQSIALMWSTAVTEAQQIGVYTGSLWLVTNDPANQNVFVPVTLTVTAPDLIISKSGPSTALPGETITYTIVYTNAGTAVASNVMITDTLPPGMTTLSPTSWNVGSVNVNGGSSIVFTATVDSNVQGAPLLTNKVVIASSDVEINANNNSAETTLQVAAPDLIISKSGPATASPDEVITYTLIYTNVGDSTAQDVMITDTLPMSVSTAAPTGWSVGAVAPSAHGAIVFTATVDHAVPGNAVLANHVVIATVTSESNTTNNAAESSLTVPPPELELSEYSIDITLPQDTLVTRTLVISNVGPTNLTWNLTETTNVTWLNESPDNGVVVPGGSTPVAVTFDTTGLAAGFYPTRLLITGNDPTHMPI